ncbi:MAG: endonuclease/exonuclease/phosphatase family protein [Cellulosilyticaceae bacterium]
MEKTLNKLVGIIGIVLLVLIVLLGTYCAFLSFTEYTPEAHISLTIDYPLEEVTPIDTPLTVATYNLGFGAYTPEFSFYEAGGEKAIASDADLVINNLTSSINTLLDIAPDFLLLQEVDRSSTRSYSSDQYEKIYRIFSDYSATFAPNYDVKWAAQPFTQMQGRLYSGQATLSNKKMMSAERIALPNNHSFPSKLISRDPCLLVTRIPTSDERELVLINVYLEPYLKDDSIIKEQLQILSELLTSEYEKDNYIIVGGDFNHLLPTKEPLDFIATEDDTPLHEALPTFFVPEKFLWAVDDSKPTVRDVSAPFQRGTSKVSLVDGFLVSNNVKILDVQTIDSGFEYSHHHPTYLSFELKGRRRRARP